jgi:hypothetical protein
VRAVGVRRAPAYTTSTASPAVRLARVLRPARRRHGRRHRSASVLPRSVVVEAPAPGYEALATKAGSSAKYVRLVYAGPSGRKATLYVDGAKLMSNAKGDRVFAASLPGVRGGTSADMQFPFSARDSSARGR